MKKVIVMLTVLIAVIGSNVSAQTAVPASGSSTSVTMEDLIVSSITMKEGSNTVPVPNGRGTLTIVKRGTTYSDVVYTDAAGKQTRLSPNNGSTGNLPKTPCKNKIPDACFGSASQNVVMCMCNPSDLSNGNDPVSIGLLLPAVQKVREAAGRR